MKQKGLNLNKVIFYLLILFLLFLIIHYMKIAMALNEKFVVEGESAGRRTHLTSNFVKSRATILDDSLAGNFSHVREHPFTHFRRFSNAGSKIYPAATSAEKNIGSKNTEKNREQSILNSIKKSYNSKKLIEDDKKKLIERKKKELNNLPKPNMISFKYQK